jgi:transcriptional regulator with XRE-family HTH domain
MTSQIDPTIDRSLLCARLRTAREAAGLTQQAVADEFKWSLSKVNRIEKGWVAISQADLRSLLDLYGLDDEAVVGEMVGLAQRSRHQFWSRYRDVLNADYVHYLGYEDSARRVFTFQFAAIPGILQSPRYAAALIKSMSAGVDPAITDRRIEARLARKDLLQRENCPQMTFVIAEAVLHSWVGWPGDPAAMREQMEYLLRDNERDDLDIRVLPFSAGSHDGLVAGFVLLEFDNGHADVLFRELGKPPLIVGDKEKIRPFRRLFTSLLDVAEPIDGYADAILRALPTR